MPRNACRPPQGEPRGRPSGHRVAPLTLSPRGAIRDGWKPPHGDPGPSERPDKQEEREERVMRMWVIAGVLVLASTGATLAQDAAAGQQAFTSKCGPCHAVGEGATIKLGPPLNGIDGRKAGTFE